MTILFDIFPAIGHYNACFQIANNLRNAEHRVVFCVERGYEKVVQNRGFECVPVNHLLSTDLSTLQKKGIRFILKCFISIFTHDRQNTFNKNISDFETIIKKIAPNYVFLDAQYAIKTIIYYNLQVPLISLETKPLSLYDPWVPPFTSKLIPQKTIFSKFQIFLSWEKIVWKRKISNIFFRLLLFKQDYFSLYQKLAAKYHYPYNEEIDLKRPFIIGFKNIEILSMTHPSFDFPHKYLPKCYYAESRVDLNREKIILNKRYLRIIEKVCSLRKQQPNIKIIYCSLGSTSGFKKRSKMFFNKIKSVCEQNPQYIFILSVGIRYNTSYLLPLPSNMYIFQQVPQLDLLSRCDLMITHGGMNSISECIEKEIPMLVFPLSDKWDQPGNSSRVVYHGLGLRANIEKDTCKSIESKIVQIIHEYPVFKRNLSIIKSNMLNKNNIMPIW